TALTARSAREPRALPSSRKGSAPACLPLRTRSGTSGGRLLLSHPREAPDDDEDHAEHETCPESGRPSNEHAGNDGYIPNSQHDAHSFPLPKLQIIQPVLLKTKVISP